jgi:replicative DNA helicase
LFALEDQGMTDQEKYLQRDIFEYGITFVVNGMDAEEIDRILIDRILTNIVELETDKDKKTLKKSKKKLSSQYRQV